jgi:hypothetical protein
MEKGKQMNRVKMGLVLGLALIASPDCLAVSVKEATASSGAIAPSAIVEAAGKKKAPKKPPAKKPPVKKPPVKKPPVQDIVQRSLASVNALERGDYAAVARQFDARMAGVMSSEQLGQVWTGLKAQLGPYASTGSPRKKTLENNGATYTVVVIPARFGSTPLNVQFTYNPDGKIGGFYVLKPEASM